MSLDVIPKFDLMRNAALIQALEKAWPGCEAHTKAGKVVVKPMSAGNDLAVSAFILGWNIAMNWAREQMVSTIPFGEPGLRGGRLADLPPQIEGPAQRNPGSATSSRRDPRRADVARAALESLFGGGLDDTAE